MKFVSFLFLILIIDSGVRAQFSELPEKSFKGGNVNSDYMFPITPGVTNTLAGTMGELRNTHFHSGLDIRTSNMIGAAVRAAQGGYISRIVKSSFSYGNVIYVTHPDGNTTLYAHLESFKGKLAEHVRKEQYNQKSFEIDLRFNATEFPVNQGDTLAFSGNTGSSNGPHLHFDIRDKDMNALNPLDFGFEEIADKTKPLVLKIALRTMDINSRINGKFGRFEFSAFKSAVGKYSLPQSILAHGNIGIEILAYDRMDNSQFQCGINTIVMVADSQQVYKQHINKIVMPLTRGILSHFNYEVLENTYFRFNKLYVDDGNPLNLYDGTINKGIISVTDKNVSIKISLADSYKNESTISLTLKADPAVETLPAWIEKSQLKYSIAENIMKVESYGCVEPKASVYANYMVNEATPAYASTVNKVFLFDLKKAIPDSIKLCSKTLSFNLKDVVPSRSEYRYNEKDLSVYFPDSALFDTLYLNVEKVKNRKSETIKIGSSLVPLLKDIKIEWKPSGHYDSLRYSVYRIEKSGGYVNLVGKWHKGTISFSSREFGEFTILPDSFPPSVLRIALTQTYARFKILDNLSGIQSYEATINGNWLLMNYDYKTGILFSEKLDKKVPLKGDFQLRVTDWMGNEKIYKQKIL